MRLDDRYDELIDSLGGFFRSWIVYIGLELGLFARLRDAGPDGMTVEELAERSGCVPAAIDLWSWASDAHGLARLHGDRISGDVDVLAVLLDDQRPEFLGGQFVHAVVASQDWDRMLEFFRTGEPVRSRPDRYREAIERLTVQDVAVFFGEVLAAMPQLVADLSRGGTVADVHCGGGRWLIAMAQRFPAIRLVGLEFEPDSVARARSHVAAAGLSDRIEIREVSGLEPPKKTELDLAYFQYALHFLADPPATLRAAWSALRPGGRIVVLDWPLPSTPEEFRTRHGELIAGVQLDELYQGAGLVPRERFLEWFGEAGLPAPDLIDLPSGASAFVVVRPGG
jgi:SAM-dependent methyltransferase